MRSIIWLSVLLLVAACGAQPAEVTVLPTPTLAPPPPSAPPLPKAEQAIMYFVDSPN